MVSTSDDLAGIAKPGDPDLDIDVQDTVLRSVVSSDFDLILRFSEGSGWWVSHGERVDVATLTYVEMYAQFRSMDSAEYSAYIAQLEAWRDAGDLLRICGAPDRLSAIVRDRSEWLPFPRGGTPVIPEAVGPDDYLDG